LEADVSSGDEPFQLGRCALRHHLAVVEQGYPIGETVGLLQILGRQEDGHVLGGETADALPDGVRFEPGLSVKELNTALRILGRAAALPGRSEVPALLHQANVKHVIPLVAPETSAIRPPVGPGLSVHRRLAQHLYLKGLSIVEEWVQASTPAQSRRETDFAAVEADLASHVQFDTGELPEDVTSGSRSRCR
jgi:hypothetical protein